MCARFVLLGPVQQKSKIGANKQRATDNKEREEQISRARKKERQEDD